MKVFCFNKNKFILPIVILITIIVDILFVFVKSNTMTYTKRDMMLIDKYKEKKILALSFDDGPSKYTEELLKILEEEEISVTFFVLGESIEKFPNILLLENSYDHEICIHSYKHVSFTKITNAQVLDQINKTKDLIESITEKTSTYIRVPYGTLNSNVKKILKNCNLENVLWNVDSLDWYYQNKDKTVKQIKDHIKGNDIILMHDTFKETNDAAKEIIKYYKENDYIFVTISDYNRIQKIAK